MGGGGYLVYGSATLHQPRTLDDAVAVRAAEPDALVVAGGTGVLPALSSGFEPPALLDLSRVAGFADAVVERGVAWLRGGVTYTQVISTLSDAVPALAEASRTIASRQIRNRATVAGALVLGDPSGDALAALGACDAVVEVVSPAGLRRVDAVDFVTGFGTCALGPDELVAAIEVPVVEGPVAYAKAGARNAMARAVCGVCVTVRPDRVVACVVGAGPTPVRVEAPRDVAPSALAELASAAVPGHDDARASAAYRRRAAGVLARRALERARVEHSA